MSNEFKDVKVKAGNIDKDGYIHVEASSDGGGGTTYTAGENISISDDNVISATDTTYTAGENISISDDNVISATGGGSSVSPVFIDVSSLNTAFWVAISSYITIPEVPLHTGGDWPEFPHLDIDAQTFSDIYHNISDIFAAYDNQEDLSHIHFVFKEDDFSRELDWGVAEIDNVPTIIVTMNDINFCINFDKEDTPGEFTHPFYLSCTTYTKDLRLFPYYILDVTNESAEDSHTGGHNQQSTYTYTVNFADADWDEMNHTAIAKNNLLELVTTPAYSPYQQPYRGRDLENFLFYIRTPHFTTPIPVYVDVYAILEDKESPTEIYFSSRQLGTSKISGIINTNDQSSPEGISITYTEEFFDASQA